MGDTAIEWADKSWNPVTGCSAESEACGVCYAEPASYRQEHVLMQPKYQGTTYLTPAGEKRFTGKLRFWPGTLNQVTPNQSPALIFVNSMSDMFHPAMNIQWQQAIFQRMNECEQHTFLILTKRPQEMLKVAHFLMWTPNIWMGVTVENRKTISRVPLLKELRAHEGTIRFLSCEPLFDDIAEELAPHLSGIDLVICGGQSGIDPMKVRRMKPEWAYKLQSLCIQQNVAFFFKQWGNWSETGVWRSRVPKGEAIRGQVWHQYPARGIYDGMSYVDAA
jgi:protein gp37